MKAKTYAIVANKSYGLYCGIVDSFDEANNIAEVSECRHIARWFGKTGGITSLAAHGICGPKMKESRIGAPAKSAILTGVVNIFECSSEARASFEAAEQQ